MLSECLLYARIVSRRLSHKVPTRNLGESRGVKRPSNLTGTWVGCNSTPMAWLPALTPGHAAVTLPPILLSAAAAESVMELTQKKGALHNLGEVTSGRSPWKETHGPLLQRKWSVPRPRGERRECVWRTADISI